MLNRLRLRHSFGPHRATSSQNELRNLVLPVHHTAEAAKHRLILPAENYRT